MSCFFFLKLGLFTKKLCFISQIQITQDIHKPKSLIYIKIELLGFTFLIK